eukprot:m.82972 g.82972  ORF g.82972 m.82972 type:complete len:1671 (-) comp8681_c1_seq1:145-5157(-)
MSVSLSVSLSPCVFVIECVTFLKPLLSPMHCGIVLLFVVLLSLAPTYHADTINYDNYKGDCLKARGSFIELSRMYNALMESTEHPQMVLMAELMNPIETYILKNCPFQTRDTSSSSSLHELKPPSTNPQQHQPLISQIGKRNNFTSKDDIDNVSSSLRKYKRFPSFTPTLTSPFFDDNHDADFDQQQPQQQRQRRNSRLIKREDAPLVTRCSSKDLLNNKPCTTAPDGSNDTFHVVVDAFIPENITATVVFEGITTILRNQNLRRIELFLRVPAWGDSFRLLSKNVDWSARNRLDVYIQTCTNGMLEKNAFERFEGLRQLNIDVECSGTLRIGEGAFAKGLDNVNLLDLSDTGMSFLPRSLFSNMPNLFILYIHNNKHAHLHAGLFDPLSALKRLYLKNNELAMVSSTIFSHLSALEVLDLENNFLEVIEEGAFSNLTNLINLQLDNNFLFSLPPNLLANAARLTQLDLDTNKLSTFDPSTLANNINIQFIDLRNNSLKEFDWDVVRDKSNLQSLSIRSNAITSIVTPCTTNVAAASAPIDDGVSCNFTNNLNEMTRLTMDQNNIFSLPVGIFRNMFKLTRLDMHNNFIKGELLPLFVDLHSLTSINFHNNQIDSLAHGAFDGLSSLLGLNLNDNRLRSLPDNDIFSPLTRLQALHMRENRITMLPTHVFDPLNDLTVLDLSVNALSELPEGVFEFTTKVVQLLMANNQLDSLPLSVFSKLFGLKELQLNSNQLTEVKEDIFSSGHDLEMLSLERNRIQHIEQGTFDGLSKLSSLYIGYNRLPTLPVGIFSQLTSLTELYLHNNQLAWLDKDMFSSLSQLVELTLFANRLESFPSNTVFAALKNIQYLDVENNQLSTLPSGLFNGMGQLETCWLANNLFTQLPAKRDIEQLASLKVFLFHNNRLTSIEQGYFDSNTQLNTVFFNDNRLVSIPPGLFDSLSISRFGISNNRYVDFQLNELRTSALALTQLELEGIRSLSLPPASSNLIFSRNLSRVELGNVELRGDVLGFFKQQVEAGVRLSRLSLGWNGMNEETVPFASICSILCDAEKCEDDDVTLTILDSFYKNIVLCDGKNIASARVINNPKLISVTAFSHELLDVSGNRALSQLQASNASFLDVSGTNVPYSPTFCTALGKSVLLARNVLNPTFEERFEQLFTTCFESSTDVFDFSSNQWLSDLNVIQRVVIERTVLGEDPGDDQNNGLFDSVTFADTYLPARFRSNVPTIALQGTAIECNVKFVLAPLSNGNGKPAFSFDCGCSPGFKQQRNGHCTSKALSSREIAAITLSSLSVIAIVVWYGFRRKSREKYKLLQEQEEFFGKEIDSLKQGWQIDLNELVLAKKVDEGSNGEVWRGEWDGVVVAVKFLKRELIGHLDETLFAEFEKEVDFLRRTRHPHLVRFFGTGLDQHHAPFLVLEFVDLGSLKGILYEKGLEKVLKEAEGSKHRDTLDLKLNLMEDVARGMKFLHSLEVLHRDLKSGNVLVTNRLFAKITDFGSMSGKLSKLAHKPKTRTRRGLASSSSSSFSTSVDLDEDGYSIEYSRESSVSSTLSSGAGTPMYMAPEALKREPLTMRADVFSFGVLMWEVWMCKQPDIIKQELGDAFEGPLISVILSLYQQDRRLLFDENALGWYEELATKCMEFNPSERPSFEEILSSMKNRKSDEELSTGMALSKF